MEEAQLKHLIKEAIARCRAAIKAAETKQLAPDACRIEVALTIGLLVAGKHADVPTAKDVVPRQYYNSNVSLFIDQVISGINEQELIDLNLTREVCFGIWFSRYQIATGSASFDTLYSAAAVGRVLPQNVIKHIQG